MLPGILDLINESEYFIADFFKFLSNFRPEQSFQPGGDINGFDRGFNHLPYTNKEIFDSAPQINENIFEWLPDVLDSSDDRINSFSHHIPVAFDCSDDEFSEIDNQVKREPNHTDNKVNNIHNDRYNVIECFDNPVDCPCCQYAKRDQKPR